MSFVELLQEIINKFSSLEHAKLSINSNSLQKLASQSFSDLKRAIDSYEQILKLVSFSAPILVQLKEQYQEVKASLAEAQQTIELKQEQNANLLEEASKLKKHITELELGQERYSLEISALNEKDKKQDEYYEERQKDNQRALDKIKLQNMELHHQIQNMAYKLKHLESVIRQQVELRKELHLQLQKYVAGQSQMVQEISKLKQEYNRLQQQSANALQQKNVKINYLEEFVSQKMNQCLEPNPYQLSQEYDNQYNDCFQQISTQEKLLKLGHQVEFNQKQLYHLESLKNSRQPSFNNEPKQTIQSKFGELLSSPQTNSMRRVTSSIELFNGKTYKDRLQHKMENLILDIPYLVTKLDTDKKLQPFTQRQSQMVFTSFKKQQESTQLHKTYEIKVHPDPQITRRQTTHKQNSINRFRDMDPYYIHYLLIVQNIKIEEDEEGVYGILEIDMKPYFQQLKQGQIRLSDWPNWIREKLLSIHWQEHEQK